MALQQARQWTSFLSLAEMERLQQLYEGAGAAEFVRVKHARLTTVVMNMILLCMGIPFFLNRERVSVVVVGGKALLMSALCYVSMFLTQSVDLSISSIPPALPAWLPVLIFGPLAVVLLDGIKT